jgi:hypothetical protein
MVQLRKDSYQGIFSDAPSVTRREWLQPLAAQSQRLKPAL